MQRHGVAWPAERAVGDSVLHRTPVRSTDAGVAQLAFDGAALGMAITDEQGRYVQVNDAFARLVGRTADELLSVTYHDLIDSADLATAARGRLRLVSGEADSVAIEISLLHAEGHTVRVLVHLAALPGPGTLRVLAQFHDLTVRTAAQRATDRFTHALRSTVDVQRAVHAARGRDEVIAVVARHATEVFPHADGAVVELVDGDRLVYAATGGNLADSRGASVALEGSLSGLALRTRRAVRCSDTETDERVDRAACRRLGIGSMCVVPLLSGDTPIGALKISSSRTDAFDRADEEHLELLGESLRTGLRHVEEYERNQRLLVERTSTLNALEASEQRFRLAFDNSAFGILLIGLTDADRGRLLHVNEATSRITGYSQAELLGMRQPELRHPDDRVESEDGLLDFATGVLESINVERRYRRADGRDVWVHVQAASIPDECGRPLTMLAQLEDVTAARAAAQQLENQARLLELIPAVVIVRDLDGTIRWWNPAASELYGWPAEAAVGKVTHRLLATGFPDAMTGEELDATLARAGSWSGELQHLTATGRQVTVHSRQVVQPGHDGAPDTVLEINTDITERRAGELALAESEQRFRAQFTHSAVGQIVRSLDGQLLDVNPAFAAMVGQDRTELIGTSWHSMLDPASAAQSASQLAALFSGERDAFEVEKILLRSDGGRLAVHSTTSLVRDAAGRPKHLVGVLSDITARKAAERERDDAAAELSRRNSELEAANQLKLDLIGMLGHEIGTPLSVIHGYSELGADADGPLDSGEARRLFGVIERNARRLDHVVAEVLALVTVDAGKLVAAPQAVDVGRHVTLALETVASPHPVEVHCAPGLRALIQPSHLDQILVNLLTNAEKYGDGCTHIVAARAADGTVTVDIHDAGPGVPAEFRPHLFERFTRAEETSAVKKGTGLGLYIVQQLARANRGDVMYDAPRVGSVFTVRLAAA